MRVFIAGATGVLGRRVVRRLIVRGHEVTGLARSAENEVFLRSEGAYIARADIFDRRALAHFVAGHDAVLHLATSIPRVVRPRRKDWALNDALRTRGTEALMHAAVENNVKVYVQESIVHLYNRYDGSEVDEQIQPAPDLPYTLRSALTMERMIAEAVRQRGLPAITLRFGGFYGADAYSTLALINGIRNRSIPIIGKGHAIWNLIHLDDAAAAVVQAVEMHEGNTGRIFNITDDHPITMRALWTTIAEMICAPMPRTIPTALARIIVGADATRFMLISMKVSNRAARNDLHWRPQYPSVREGLQQVLQSISFLSRVTHAGESPAHSITS
ncbi:MAG TPA: NAD(P)-dependent oxidoreductase [Bacteroidota bacterium]|nr:NAD(P)-dependent oxidoreductase [Bacteroidota bacterium]